MTYLIVDDYAPARSFVRELIECPGDKLLEACNGLEALKAFSSHLPDWTIMDIDMPGMDGLTTARRIRNDFTDARIIIVTQHDDPDIRSAAREAGATAFLPKDSILDLPALLNTSLENS